jgi:single-strand DNA-binding protein
MASLNKVQIIGRLGQNPEIRYTTSGTAVCNISVATTENYKDAAGNKKEATEWHRVVLYRGLAERAERLLKKGAQVYVEGRIKTEKWQDKDGRDRYTTKIEGTEMKALGKAPDAPADDSRRSDSFDDLPH